MQPDDPDDRDHRRPRSGRPRRPSRAPVTSESVATSVPTRPSTLRRFWRPVRVPGVEQARDEVLEYMSGTSAAPSHHRRWSKPPPWCSLSQPPPTQHARTRERRRARAVKIEREAAQGRLVALAPAGEERDRRGRAEAREADHQRDVGLHDGDQAATGGPERARQHDRRDVADRERHDRRADRCRRRCRRPRSAAARDGGGAHLSHRSVSQPLCEGPDARLAIRGRQRRAGSTIVRAVRILLVTPGLGLGGSERLTVAYARGLAARGHDVLHRPRPARARSTAADVAGIAPPPHRRSGRPPRTFAEWIRALRSIVREFRPDVAHAQSVRSTLVVAAARPAHCRCSPRVHGIEESEERMAALAAARQPRAASRPSRRPPPTASRATTSPRASSSCRPASTSRRSSAPRWSRRRRRCLRAPAARRLRRPATSRSRASTCSSRPSRACWRPIPAAGLLLVGGGPDHDALIARARRARHRATPCSFTGRQHNPAAVHRRGRSGRAAVAPRGPARRRARGARARAAPSSRRPSAARPTSCSPARPAGSSPPDQPAALAAAIVEALSDPVERAERARRGRELVDTRLLD